MASEEVNGLSSLGYFNGVSVDDKKYETLLEDLRAHDLLGPVEDSYDGSIYGTRSSILLNDNLSAIFCGNVPKDKPNIQMNVTLGTKITRTPPPGFTAAPTGSAPTQADLEWARSQQEFTMLRNEFNRKTPGESIGFNSAGGGFPKPFLYTEEDEDDDGLLDQLHMKTLVMDDEDEKRANVIPPTPESLPPPRVPGPPPGMAPPTGPISPAGSNFPPPPHHVLQQVQGHPGLDQPPAPLPPHHHQHPHGFPNPGPPPHMLPPHMHMHGPPHPNMMMYPPPPVQLVGGYPPHVIMNQKIFKVMNPRDVQFVVQQQLKQIRSSDPFSDDYYFHNYNVKRERAKAISAAAPPLPLPSWKLEHVKSFDPRDASRANRSREWETENQVLGRTAKSSLYKPRELIQVPSDDGAEAVLTRPVTPVNSVFFNDTWSKRQRIDEGMVHLLALQDARHILDARRVNVQQFHQMDVSQMDPALIELREKTTTLLLDLAKVLGVSSTSAEVDHQILWSILSASKGMKLVCRALPLLHPSARFMLFPLLVQYMLTQPLSGEQKSEDTIADEDRLAQTLVVALLYQQPSPPPQVLADSLQRALEGQTLQALSLVLHNRARAELLQALLQKGGVVCAAADVDTKAKWLKYQDLFVELASRIKEATHT